MGGLIAVTKVGAILVKQHSGEIIKRARKKKQLTQFELGKQAGITHSYISMWERGERIPSYLRVSTIVEVLEDALNVSRHELLEMIASEKQQFKIEIRAAQFAGLGRIFERPREDRGKRLYPVDLVQVPILGEVPAGHPIRIDPVIANRAEEFEYVPAEIVSDPEQVFGLRVLGESMIGRGIQEGNVIIIDAGATVENGDVAVVMIQDEAMVKEVHFVDDILILRSANPSVPLIRVTDDDKEGIRIVGKVIRIVSAL